MVPIFKKGSKNDAGNYRLVSLTCVVCKLFERLVKNRIVANIENNSLISGSQHGFRNNLSCTTNAIEFMNWVTGEVDSGNPCDIIYFDFSKAFDKVAFNRLLLKLECYGVRRESTSLDQ